MMKSIAAATGMGTVHLSVTDGERAFRFYKDTLGLTLLRTEGGAIHLGAGSRELIVLHPGAAQPVVRGTTGLYHLALVVPSKRELARVVGRLFSLRYQHAPTDHVMTKSDYVSDPDGNGIEVYAETPEDGSWSFADGEFFARDSDGVLRSGTDPLDAEVLLKTLTPSDRLDVPMPEGTKMGHVHLHVADVDDAIHFYHDILGFDIMGLAPAWGVGFVSAGGYHHHLGLNIWAGKGAPPAPPGAAGLRHFTIELPTESDLEDVRERLRGAGVEASEDSFVRDPSGNRVHLTLRTAGDTLPGGASE